MKVTLAQGKYIATYFVLFITLQSEVIHITNSLI